MRYVFLIIFFSLSITVKAQFYKLIVVPHYSYSDPTYVIDNSKFQQYPNIDFNSVFCLDIFNSVGKNIYSNEFSIIRSTSTISTGDIYLKNAGKIRYGIRSSSTQYLFTYNDIVFSKIGDVTSFLSYVYDQQLMNCVTNYVGLIHKDILTCSFSYYSTYDFLCPQDIEGKLNFIYPDLEVKIYIEVDGRKNLYKTLKNEMKFAVFFDYFKKNGWLNKKFSLIAEAEGIVLRKVDGLKMLDYYQLNENELYVKDFSLHTSLQEKDSLTMYSYFKQDDDNRKHVKIQDLENGYVKNTILKGPYTLIFQSPNYCPIERYVFVPEVNYNYVNNADSVSFWYENEKSNAITLNYKYPKDCTEKFTFNHSPNNSCNITTKESTDGKIVVYDIKDNSILHTMNCMVDSVFFYSDKNLKKIDVTIKSDNDKKFVPVQINLNELKYYPKITKEADVNIDQPKCNYSDAILTFPKFDGGLRNGYFYQINDEKALPIPENNKLVLDDKLTSFTLKVFDNTENKDTTGRIARSLDLKSFDISRPQSIEFLDTVSTPLSCYHDNTGSFEVNKVQLSYPEKTVTYNWYKFPYTETDKLSISESVAGGLAAGNYIVVVENNGCKDTAYFTLSEPEFPLEISKDTVKNPVCFGYSNGRIITHTTGGTQPYTYSWNTGSQDTAIYNLKAGTYILSVTDSHGCKDTATQELVDPEELQNSLTPSHTICKNGELKIDEGDLKSEDLHYSWLLPNQMVHNERVLVVKSDMPEGNYVMITQDTSGCFTADTTNIKFSDNELNIKFLAPTYSYLGDTVVLAEDSEVYKNFSWSYVFNEDMFTDITSSMSGAPYNHTFLESFKYGSDTITMYANDGRCNASYSKVVNILNEQRADYSDYNAPSAGIFTRLAIGPSYNDGNFTLFANLTEESELKMFILDLQRGVKIPLKYNSNYVSDHYAIPFHGLNISEGVYALFVTANGDTNHVKFTVK